MAADQMHEPSPACIPARLAGTVRSPLAVQLERDVLAALGGHGWVRYPDLLALAPEGRVTVIPELESEQPFGYDDPRGASYDAGPSGRPDGGMLADVLTHLRDELLTGEGYPDGAGRSVRLYDPEERVGLGEIAERLRVKRDTVDHWRVRGVLPETGLTEGRRPRWPWRAIRDWAFATGRDAGARRAMWLLALPLPVRPERMPEPFPEGARWEEVAGLGSLSGDDVRAFIRDHAAPGVMLLVSPTGRMEYGQPPHLSVTASGALAVTVAGEDMQQVQALSWRGWFPGDAEYRAQIALVREFLRQCGTADREQIRAATGVPWHILRAGHARGDLGSAYGRYSASPEQTSFEEPDPGDDWCGE